jgi:phosphate starvation-inducible membrane PsiE
MSEQPFNPETIKRFAEKIDEVVDYFSQEYHMPFSAAIGVLNMKAIMMVMDHVEDSDE